ncbi:MAG: phosphatidate cytidylyltransferase [Candidatus Chromulinivorax sp.]|nr:phosphatidate cytidylyltransferase [Candidatus Chromulinivorax sp.]
MAIKKFMISENGKLRIITAIFLVAGLWLMFFYVPPIILSIAIVIAMCIMLQELHAMLGTSLKFVWLAPLYPITPCLILIYFNQTPEYKYLLIYLFVLIFKFDSGSYLIGKVCSKFWTTHKIIPTISPGKSWEGVCGGFTFATMVLIFITKKICWHIYALSAVICTIAFVGDIFESYLKRSANIKDSGTILPGHGGLLDRFDAILFVSYFFFIFKNYLVMIFA